MTCPSLAHQLYWMVEMNSAFYKIFADYDEISVRYDAECQAVWCYYKPGDRLCFSLKMLQELRQMQQNIIDYFATLKTDSESPIRYQVLYSQVPGVYSFGGDLALFSKLIKGKERQQLLNYAELCVDITYLNSVNMHLPVTTISLVEGKALGGGFESALSSNILIATENSEMGFPEIRFNLFPGMGAYSLLSRSCGKAVAEKMITSGMTYGGKELYEKGIVHHLAENGAGQESVRQFIHQHRRLGNGRRAVQKVRQKYQPLEYQELADITEIWVDTAMGLEDKDLRLIDRLVNAQSVKVAKRKKGSLLRAAQDRRFIVTEPSFPLMDWLGETVMFDRRKSPDRRLFN